MKKVEFVRLKSMIYGFGLGKGAKYMFEDAEVTIKKWIEDGWQYEGYLPFITRGTGDIETMSLIFTKDEE